MKKAKVLTFGMVLCAFLLILGACSPPKTMDFPIITTVHDEEGALKRAYLTDAYTREEWSLFPFAHPNSSFKYTRKEGGRYTLLNLAGSVSYEYSFEPFSEPMIRFREDGIGILMVEDGRYIYSFKEKDGVLYLCNLPEWKLLQKKNKICELPEGDPLYAPIKVHGLGEFVILVMEDYQSPTGEIAVYLPPENWLKGTWKRAKFQCPDGTVSETFAGLARRSFRYTGSVEIEGVGYLELRQDDEEVGARLYQVNYSDGTLVLEEDVAYRGAVFENWHF